MKKIILTIGSLLLAGSLFAEFVKIDDMESYTPDTQLMDSPWTWYTVPAENFSVIASATVVPDPFGAGQGQVLQFDPGVPAAGSSNATLEYKLPDELRIKDPFPATGVLSTFYFRVARPLVSGAPAEADITWGLMSEGGRDETSGEFGYSDYSVLGRIEKNGIPDIRDESTETKYVDLTDTALNTNVWYEFWFVVDHAANTFSQYIKGGTDFPEQTMVYSDAEYRFETFLDLENIVLVTTAGGVTNINGKDPMYFDDFYMTIGAENLTSPGAPVVDTTPRAEAAAIGATTITVANLPAGIEAGLIVAAGETELGIIASIDGMVITLEEALTVAVEADTALTFSAVDTTPQTDADVDAGATEITVAGVIPAEVVVGYLVFDDGGTELGKIAMIDGQVITLDAGLAAAIPAGSRLTFVEDNVEPPAIAGQLINLSTRSQVGTGDDVLIGGFVVGLDSQQVLIQAVGPELANSGVTGPLLDPFLTITNTGTNEVVATNDNWQDTQGQLISDLWGGAPPMADQSLSAGAVVTLEPGTYTATISGVGDTTGVALIEVYELDN